MTYSDDAGATWTASRGAHRAPVPRRLRQRHQPAEPRRAHRGDRERRHAVCRVGGQSPCRQLFADGEPASVSFTVPRLLYRRTNASQPSLTLASPGPRSNGVPGYSQPYPELNPGDRAYVYLPLTNFVTNPSWAPEPSPTSSARCRPRCRGSRWGPPCSPTNDCFRSDRHEHGAVRHTTAGVRPARAANRLQADGCDRPRHRDAALCTRDRYADCDDDPH